MAAALSQQSLPELPDELWATIFRFCMPSDEVYLRWEVVKPPFTLAMVCKMWRTTAIGTPRLWSSLYLSGNKLARWRSQLDILLKRSGAMPLSLRLSQPIDFQDPDGLHDILAQLSSASGRWRSLHLYVSVEVLDRLLDSPTSCLQTLTVATHSQTELDRTFTLLEASSLRSFTFAGEKPFSWALPWPQLKQLKLLHRLPVVAVLSLLRLCSRLEECRLSIDDFIADPSDPANQLPVTRCENLQKLSLTLGHGRDLTRFFNAVELPALEELELMISQSGKQMSSETWSKDHISEFVGRSKVALRKVIFWGSAPADADLQSFVESITTLQEIEYECIGLDRTGMVPEAVASILNKRSALLPGVKHVERRDMLPGK